MNKIINKNQYDKDVSKTVDILIHKTMKKFNISSNLFDKIKYLVEKDYDESDISQVTQRDIVEIMDASGI